MLYGAAEFSRDIDIAILADSANLARLAEALADLKAEVIAFPPFDVRYLVKGHAVHFRCSAPEADRVRLDVMSSLRGLDLFPELWSRRTTFDFGESFSIDVLSLPDLVQAKKTQRDKDWPMLRLLVEVHHAHNQSTPTDEHLAFWLREARSPGLLLALARQYPDQTRALLNQRPLLTAALANDENALLALLEAEEKAERDADRVYWLPLKREVESLRLQRTKGHGA